MKNLNKSYSVLMYHEVSAVCPDRTEENFMTPIYNLSASAFEQQLRAIKTLGCTTGFVHDIGSVVSGAEDIVFLTFDDGCIGNYTEVLPLLLQYGQKATFFVTTNLIGTDNYMDWDQVKDLVDQGMAVQSHAMNHEHLTTLGMERLKNELVGSRKMIEDKVGKPVTAISFPHGSYNQRTVDYAVEAGYSVLCTSDVCYNSACNIGANNTPLVLGRIAITTKTTIDSFLDIVQGSKSELLKEGLRKGAKNLLKRIIGINNYGRLYRLYFHIKDD